ncbi:MAG: NUDIX hydrolase [Acidimicrobiia bacterium]
MPGAQRIPRPANFALGAPAPWAHLTRAARTFTIHEVRSACRSLPLPRPPRHLPREPRVAAVLLTCMQVHDEAHVVLIKRPEHMPTHQGQIAFPGGAHEPEDVDLQATAVREAREEIGLGDVELLGELDTIATVASPFVVTPFVGVVASPTFVPDPGEVDAVFSIPISQLLDAEIFREEIWDLSGIELFTPPEQSVYFFELPTETVWGATARILRGFLAHLAGMR